MDNKCWLAVKARIDKLRLKSWKKHPDICFWLFQVAMKDRKPSSIHPDEKSDEAQAYRALVEIEELRAEVARLKLELQKSSRYDSQLRYWRNKLKMLQRELRSTYDFTWRLGVCDKQQIWHPDVQEFIFIDLENEYDNDTNFNGMRGGYLTATNKTKAKARV